MKIYLDATQPEGRLVWKNGKTLTYNSNLLLNNRKAPTDARRLSTLSMTRPSSFFKLPQQRKAHTQPENLRAKKLIFLLFFSCAL